jgi:hypothetical protein
MKEETNNEMDLLLRRLGRRPDTSVSDTNGDVDHLDADELSAYAENVLPAPARARYTEHLAECARCRELVVQLSSSAGVVPAATTVKAQEPSALKKFLASLFSPLVMRYAIPALGLIVVAAIGLFVLRQDKNQNGASIAQTTEAPKSTGVVTQEAQQQNSPNYAFTQPETPAKPARNAGSPESQIAGAAPEPTAAPKATPAPATVNGTVDSFAKEPAQPVTTGAPAANAPKPAATTDSREQQADTEARDEAAQAKFGKAPTAEKANKTEEAAKTKPKDRKAADIVSPGFSGLTAGPSSGAGTRAGRADGEDKDKNAETRTVAGRRFRKQGGVWIDTAYESSRSAINLTRGSEQYRALVADEPAIKTIADQLDGEILVLWKGHAYHIH